MPMSVESVARRITLHMAGNMGRAIRIARDEAQDSFMRAKSGRFYRRSSGEKYRASAPGEPPAIKDGNLSRSIKTMVLVRAAFVAGILSANTRYARFLELGTTRMLPRPYLRPAIMKKKSEIVRELQRP